MGTAVIIGTEVVPVGLSAYLPWEVAKGVVTTGRANDSDKDGWTNEFEYFFGMDPEDAGNQVVNMRAPTASTVTDTGLDYPAIEFNYRNDGSVSTYVIETSDDLVIWTPSSWTMAAEGADWTLVGVDTVIGNYTTTKVRWNVDYSLLPNNRIFYRVVATE